MTTVAADILRYCVNNLGADDQFQLTAEESHSCAKFWSYLSPPVKAPKPFAWPGDSGLAFTRLPWLPSHGETPTWNRIFERMSNAEAFMTWIGSLFDETSYQQQYVWLHGKGNEGKGCINRFLMRVFGPAYCAKQPKERGDKFWTHELMGKRLVVFPDCNDQALVASGLFKSMTGGDPIPVEAKGEMAYTTRLNAKYLIISNERPSISSETADKRRIIYCEISPRVGAEMDDEGFETRLWEEGGAFLGRCLAMYQKTAGKPIACDSSLIADWVETVEMEFSEVFDFYFEVDTTNAEKGLWATGETVQRALKLAYKSPKSRHEFLSWMERVKGITRRSVKFPDNKVAKLYIGLCHKNYISVVDGNRSGRRSVDTKVDTLVDRTSIYND